MTAFANTASTTPAATALLRTLVLCDLADSTALTERLGDRDAADLFRRHDRLVRDLLPHHAGREIDKTDGFLLVFERPVQAVAFALDYQRQLAELAAERKLPLAARVGIHCGDVVVWENERDDVERGAKPTEVEGLVKPVTARLAQLALPGQILLSGTAYDIAHRAQGELGAQLGSVRWLAHGRYRFKGVPDPVPVFEVGEEGIAPLKAPPWSSKAHREVPFWRRPATLAAELTLLAVAIAVPALYLLKPAPAIAFANRDWVVVGDLKNLTGESKFDESLQAAFRIGLEQSRYVNVMSDLKARETLKLMQRDPDKTPIDRGVGAEIALRDSARALILPTVAEVGGRVRVTAEVVDPKSQATVYSESADGIGEDSVLPSLDKVNQKLRVRLGEALATVSSETKPLDKAATKNLDALRAYTLGRRAYYSNNIKEALEFEQQALTLDPDFALARTTIASIYYSVGDYVRSQQEIERAAASKNRLSARDALYVDAWKAQFGPPLQAISKWKALAKLYPDFPLASGSVGYYSWQENFFSDALQATKDSISPGTPRLGWHEAMLGILLLGTEQYEEAERHFEAAKGLGLDAAESRSATYAAKRQFNRIDPAILKVKGSDLAGQDVASQNARVAFAADQGRWSDVWNLLDREEAAIPSERVRSLRKLEAVNLSLRALTGTGQVANTIAIQKFVKSEQAALGKEISAERAENVFNLLFAAYIAATQGDTKLAVETLSQLDPAMIAVDYPVLNRMEAVVRAEITRSTGKPKEAIRLLRERPLDGSELYLTHVVLLAAHADDGDTKSALEQARWLASHRGRAYAEFNGDWVARPYNVVQSDLALLREAELSWQTNKDQARVSLHTFFKAWPSAKDMAFVSQRIAELEKHLE